MTDLRRQAIGFVFQNANLLPFLTIEQNLAIAGRNAGIRPRALATRVTELCELLQIEPLRPKFPAEASGGERQRAAIARAVLHRPRILLADEPTAALDWENGQRVVTLLTEQAHRDNAVLVTVTHDPRIAQWHDRVLHMDSGVVAP
jgi:putative ABC transport system ATP-binding protein